MRSDVERQDTILTSTVGHAAVAAVQVAPPRWSGPDWPSSLGRGGGGSGAPGTSIGMGMSVGMGTSPFGRSVDMVDVVTQLMEAGGVPRPPPPPRFCWLNLLQCTAPVISQHSNVL